jgi:hypothetical protein
MPSLTRERLYMSSYVQKVLAPDERVVYAAVIHWIIYVQGLMFTAAGGLLAFYGPTIISKVFDTPGAAEHLTKPIGLIAGLLVIAGLSLLMGAYIRQNSTELVVTNMRVIAKYGFVSRATFELMLNRVTGVNFDQTIGGRILGYGTIIVRGAGGDISPIDLVSDPQTFHNRLMSAVEHVRM